MVSCSVSQLEKFKELQRITESFRAEETWFGRFITKFRVNTSEGGSGINEYVASLFDQSLTWKDVEWLKSITTLPIIVKGMKYTSNNVKWLKCTSQAYIFLLDSRILKKEPQSDVDLDMDHMNDVRHSLGQLQSGKQFVITVNRHQSILITNSNYFKNNSD